MPHISVGSCSPLSHLSFFYSLQRTCNFTSLLSVSPFLTEQFLTTVLGGWEELSTSVCAALLHPQDKKEHIDFLCSQRVKSGKEHSLGAMQGPSSEGNRIRTEAPGKSTPASQQIPCCSITSQPSALDGASLGNEYEQDAHKPAHFFANAISEPAFPR